ncbi:scavenger receptor class B member 1-like [Anoplophora glabripennis]|uniref:scavenger receptor class B member 1-like n=1 Tax=Anoplophora glabripennis TaxID=217634 RepID=UPI0008748E20|nr:scavenger receptor class B member 1-like [Anoplophora glabripennis]
MTTEIRYKINGRILSLALVGLLMVVSSCLIFVYDPVQLILKKLLALSPGTVFFNLWSAPPYDVVMKLYIFNFTNVDKFLSGEEKMNVTQVGPYSYKEILTNNNATFGDDGTVTYSPRRDFIVDPENSVGDPNLDRVIVPNIPLLGIQSYLADSSFLTSMGFSAVAASLGSEPVLDLTVDEFLWGYEDKLVTVANQFLPNWIDFGTFGLLERLISRDNTNEVTISVEPDKHKSKFDYLLTDDEQNSQFHIVRWNGLPGLKEWGYDPSQEDENTNTTKKCQLVEGAFDGTIFPKHLKKDFAPTIFRKAFCRPVEMEFVEESTTAQGFRSYNYKLKDNMFASPEENPSNECYCFNGKCPAKGLQTIAPCYYDIPIVLSQPHFLNVDPEILATVNGLNPNMKDHGSVAKVQPDLGVPLDESTLKIQVNLEVGKTRFNSKTRPFNDLTIPLFWIELTCNELPTTVYYLVTLIVSVLPVAEVVLKYLLLLMGLAMISGAALLTLFFSKTVVPRSLSIASEYSPIPLINISSQYFKPEIRICK